MNNTTIFNKKNKTLINLDICEELFNKELLPLLGNNEQFVELSLEEFKLYEPPSWERLKK